MDDENSVTVKTIEDSALSNFKTFLKTSQCFKSVYSEYNDTQRKTIILDKHLLNIKF